VANDATAMTKPPTNSSKTM